VALPRGRERERDSRPDGFDRDVWGFFFFFSVSLSSRSIPFSSLPARGKGEEQDPPLAINWEKPINQSINQEKKNHSHQQQTRSLTKRDPIKKNPPSPRIIIIIIITPSTPSKTNKDPPNANRKRQSNATLPATTRHSPSDARAHATAQTT
jgi:hypothetical protein